MKKTLIILLLLSLAIPALAVRFPVGIVYTKEGSLTQPDSVRIDITFYPSGTDTVFGIAPDTAIWDSTLNISGITDLFADIVYTIYSGSDTAFGSSLIRLEYDSSSFQASFWREIADAADSGAVANAGIYVWTYGTRELTAISNVSLTAAERQAIADSARAEMERSGGFMWNLAYYFGACDSCLTVYYPNDGTSPKDSVVIYSKNGTAQMTIRYGHSNNPQVADTSRTFDR